MFKKKKLKSAVFFLINKKIVTLAIPHQLMHFLAITFLFFFPCMKTLLFSECYSRAEPFVTHKCLANIETVITYSLLHEW